MTSTTQQQQPYHLPGHLAPMFDGCSESLSCLICPLPECVIDAHGAGRQSVTLSARVAQRNASIRKDRAEGMTTTALASKYGLASRVVWAIISQKSAHRRTEAATTGKEEGKGD